MSDSTDFAVLAQSIGEHAIDYIGKERIRALSVEINPVTLEADVEVVLRDSSDGNRRAALEAFRELEDLFYDEVVLGHNFVGELHERARATADARRHFQFV